MLLYFLIPAISAASLERSHVRLVGGRREWEGRVEMFRDGEWGTICDDRFSKEAAEVVCRMLGFHTEQARLAPAGVFGQGRGIIWADNVKCTGFEMDVALCERNAWGMHNCDHNEDVAITCPPPQVFQDGESSTPPSTTEPNSKEGEELSEEKPDYPFGTADLLPNPIIQPLPPKAGSQPSSSVGPPAVKTADFCNGHGSLTCTCDPGYRGPSCEEEIDWCDEPLRGIGNVSDFKMSHLCGQHGKCSSSPQGINCLCEPRFFGPFCEKEDREDRWESVRCGLYSTPRIADENIMTSCPQREGADLLPRQHCIPDNLDCFYLNCDFPVGWCLPTTEENYLKLRKSSGRR